MNLFTALTKWTDKPYWAETNFYYENFDEFLLHMEDQRNNRMTPATYSYIFPFRKVEIPLIKTLPANVLFSN